MTPTARSLAHCRRLGWLAQVVEQTIPRTFIKRDLFGFGDILALDGQPGALLIQATSGANAASRATKIREQCWEAASAWLGAGNRLEVWSFAKQGKQGARKLWTLRRVAVTT